MIRLVRRHTMTCKHREKGDTFLNCRCPIWARGSENGKPVRKSMKTCDMERAGARLRAMGDDLFTDRKSIPEACRLFMAAQDVAEGTRRNNQRVMDFLQAFCEESGVRYVHLVKVEHVDGYRQTRKIAVSTWGKELEILRHFFRFCVDRDWTKSNPAKKVKTPKVKPTKKTPYTPAEVIAILGACDRLGRGAYERQRAKAMVLLMRYCGLSVVDVATLRRDEIRDGMLDRGRFKTGEIVRIPLPPVLVEVFNALPQPRAAAGDPQFVFWSGNGTVRSAQRDITRTLSQVFTLSGVPNAHAHKFRHTLATELLDRGWSFEDAAIILGSSPAIIRKHYAQWSVKRQERITSLLQTVHAGTILEQTRDEDSKVNDKNSLNGGRHGIRTHDPHVANVVLSQLS